jgi:maltose alpha-D-glucosyltransferase/alpha-amylase
MYRVYAADPQARINVGIRRRLAPLMGNNRREIELMHALLLTLPGTPVLYYGDEIGMGDNVYLGDRNGVRTPMQWSGDRNAGFSTANPQSLYFPVITDPEYHYESVNVEVQRANPSSLWWWVKRALSLRKSMPELTRGDLEFLQGDNPKVLTYLRSAGDRSVLVVANLSRHTQPVEVDLSRFDGVEPVEVFGRIRFPAVGPGPYRLTIGPHDFYWFSLDRSEAVPEEPAPGIVVEGELADILRGGSRLETALVSDIQRRRWFRSKAQTVRNGRLAGLVDMPGTDSVIAFLQVDYVEADAEIYVMPLAVAGEVEADRLTRETPTALIAEIRAGSRTGALYDALHDPSLVSSLLDIAAGRAPAQGASVSLVTETIPDAGDLSRDLAGVPMRVVGAEQTNTSVVVGEQMILKLLRKFEPGPNPEVEMGRFLTEKTGFEQVARTRGVVNAVVAGKQAALAVIQDYVPNQGDAFEHTTGALTLAFEEMAAQLDSLGAPPPGGNPLDISDDELESARGLIAVPLHEAALLGERTGELHLALISAPDDPVFAPERVTTLYQRSLYQALRSSLRSNLALLRRRRHSLGAAEVELADAVLAREADLLAALSSITKEKIEAVRLRTHGDYHLGQVLFTGNDFVVIDFEGEPLRPLSERRIKQLGLRDVAGMLRSYQYAARSALAATLETRVEDPDHVADLTKWAEAVDRWLEASFLRGYLGVVGETPIVPAESRHLRWLLDSLLIAKAAYELGYELNNRPDWVEIPLRGLLGAGQPET